MKRAKPPRRLPGDKPPRYLTIGQTARLLGLSPSTLRLWENVGLVRPARTDGRYRLYGTKALERLKRIQYLRTAKHLNIAAIRHLLGEDKGTVPPSVEPRLGIKLRQLRKRRRLKLREVASRAEISTGFLSAIERSRANPSVATIHRLAGVLGVNVHQLFDHEKATKRVVHPKERRVYQPQPGVRVEFLATSTTALKSMLFRVAPGAGSEGAYFHEGEEFLYVLEGQLEIWLDEMDRYVLEPGDTLSFQSSYGHRWLNPSKTTEAVLIWVNTTPPME
ncbi:MAG TPA: MerR family transcriptional regulator [Vicinamibacteria bacterium]|nr:MerR family transcriptional regulator [Vicinamibacteria bacterium]